MSLLASPPLPLRLAPDGVYEVSAADLFCGAGGTCTGLLAAIRAIEARFGITIRVRLVAVNHWPVAIKTHSLNHKFAMHYCDSLKGVQPRVVIPGPLDLLIASPECTHHSNARGGRPMDDQSRASGADVVRWTRELARAQSFPDDYQFVGSTADVVKQIGNAVPGKTAQALCEAILLS